MLNREYFFKFESLPSVRGGRVLRDKITMSSGTVSFRSFAPNTDQVIIDLLRIIKSDEPEFHDDGVILTSLCRL